MKNKGEKVWVGERDLKGDKGLIEESKNEFFDLPVLNDMSDEESGLHQQEPNRRDFLKYLGFGIGAATIAASCETPVRRAIPYVQKPDAIVPGNANYYASTFVNGSDVLPVVVKTREGRPIKIEGNKESSFSKGGTSARAQASVLELYDSTRYKHPGKVNDKGDLVEVSWEELDGKVRETLTPASEIRWVGPTNASPTLQYAFKKFKKKYPRAKWVNVDGHSKSGMLLANDRQFGKKAIPHFRFDRADVVVNFGADFLGTWISPVQFAKQWSQNRKIQDIKRPRQSRMIMFESFMSLTGSNADNRVLLRPSEQGLAIAKLHDAIAQATGGEKVNARGSFRTSNVEKGIRVAAEDLVNASRNGQNTLIVSGSNNTAEQMLINSINQMLGNYGKTLLWDREFQNFGGVDAEMKGLMNEVKDGKVDAVLFAGDANPVYSFPGGSDLKESLKNIPLTISLGVLPNETSSACDWIAPTPHFLESWGDVEAQKGVISIMQPTIAPIFKTRQAAESMLNWASGEGEDQLDMHAFMKECWKQEVFPRQSKFMSFDQFWRNALHDGGVELSVESSEPAFQAALSGITNKITKPSSADVEASFFETINMGAGQHANNPWLQEMPDPLTRTVWDNCLNIPVKWDGGNSIGAWKELESGDVVELSGADIATDVTVVRQFGMPEHCVAIAMGYGRKVCGRAGANVGTDIVPFLQLDDDGNIQYFSDVNVSDKKGEDKTFASVQYHHTYGVKDEDPETGETINVDEKAIVTLSEGYQGSIVNRTVIRQTDMSHFEEAVDHLQHEREHHQHLNEQTLYPGHDNLYDSGHKWELSVDLSSCIGCGACQVACIAENNVPVVGKNEVRRHHEMTWLRIDRYFYGDFENPNTVYQPMMCQHCDNAPCENVCPVAATNHSSEGLNQMTYNRCIGTRYCANNCPYKVRRFNWLDYTTADLFGYNENKVFENDEDPFYADNLTRLVLNPDVTVRTRGVIEKCSFCVQRIQEGKLRAKTEQRELREGDVTPACASACPTGSIVFGDVNNKETQVSKEKENPLNYYVLEETNTRSSVGYKMKVVNRNKKLSATDA